MRFDKLTTKFQQAIADAQSMALAADSGYIEPQHLLLSLLNQQDSGATSLLSRAGVNVARTRSRSDVTALPIAGSLAKIGRRPIVASGCAVARFVQSKMDSFAFTCATLRKSMNGSGVALV